MDSFDDLVLRARIHQRRAETMVRRPTVGSLKSEPEWLDIAGKASPEKRYGCGGGRDFPELI